MSGVFDVGPNIFSIGGKEVPLYVVPSGRGLSTITIPFLMTKDRTLRYTKLRDVEVHSCEASDGKGLNRVREIFPRDAWLYVGCGPQRLFIQSNSLEAAVDRLKTSTTKEIVRGLVRKFFGLPFDPFELPYGHRLSVNVLFDSDECNRLCALRKERYKITTAACPSLSIVSLKTFYLGRDKVHRKAIVLHSQDKSLMGQMVVLTKSSPAGKDEWLKREVRATNLLPFERVPNIVRPTLVHRGIGNEKKDYRIGLVSKWFGDGNLSEYIKANGPSLGRKERLSFSLQIAETLCQIHTYQMVYGDLKPENILVRVEGGRPQLFLCDFGLSASVGAVMTFPLGTYPSPESLVKSESSKKIITQPIDCWAFGLTLFGLLHGTPSFLQDFHYTSNWEKVMTARGKLINSLNMEDRADELIEQLLDLDPSKRPDMVSVVKILQTL